MQTRRFSFLPTLLESTSIYKHRQLSVAALSYYVRQFSHKYCYQFVSHELPLSSQRKLGVSAIFAVEILQINLLYNLDLPEL